MYLLGSIAACLLLSRSIVLVLFSSGPGVSGSPLNPSFCLILPARWFRNALSFWNYAYYKCSDTSSCMPAVVLNLAAFSLSE
jgi:hypothetical protein